MAMIRHKKIPCQALIIVKATLTPDNTWVPFARKGPVRGRSNHCCNGSYGNFSLWKFRLVFVPRSGFDRHYLYCQFQQSSFREELAQSASGTSNSHQRVRPVDVLHKAVIVPPSPVRKGFADIADPLFALSAANHAESATLAEVRDYLLPTLLSGQVRVEVVHG